MDNELLVKTIRNLCKKHNITPSQLETELTFGAGLISRWTKSSPSLDKIIDIADYFHVTLDEVVGRNKNNHDENYDFISTIIEQTKIKELQWEDIISSTLEEQGYKIITNSDTRILGFNNFPNRRRETFVTKCNDGFLTLECWLVFYNNAISQYDFSFYIQPNVNIEYVYQECDQEQLLELYKSINTSINGKTPEMEAVEFKKQFKYKFVTDNYQRSLDKVSETTQQMNELMNNEQLANYLATVNNSDIRKIIELYTDPKMMESLQNTQRFIQYLTRIKNYQNDKRMAKTFNEVLEEQSDD